MTCPPLPSQAFETRELPWSALAAWGDEGEGGRRANPTSDEAHNALGGDEATTPASPAPPAGLVPPSHSCGNLRGRGGAAVPGLIAGFALPPAVSQSPDVAIKRLATPAFSADEAPPSRSLLAPRRAAKPGRSRPPAFAQRNELPWAALGNAPLLTRPSGEAGAGHSGPAG